MRNVDIYQIQNANFTPIYNNLNIFTKVLFKEVDTINHNYAASLNTWRKILHIHHDFLNRLKKQFNADDDFIIQVINNVINYNLINIDLDTKFTFSNENKTFKEWSLSRSLSKYDCLFVYYAYGPNTLYQILNINPIPKCVLKQAPKQIINNKINNEININNIRINDKNNINNNGINNKNNNEININDAGINNDNDTIINWKNNGILITYNNITNNRYGWTKLITGITHNYAMVLLKNNPNKFFNKLKIKPNTVNYFKINDIYATYEQWSLFINEPRTYLEDMIMSMGQQYTYNFLYTTIVNNTDFITKKKLITINNESNTLFGWAKKINKSESYLYILNKNQGMDYVVKYIKKHLKA